ncbi:MAG: hypothetical protein ACI86M_002040 [Saprospiraceae bacterium]|jgi:hypothetical protein
MKKVLLFILMVVGATFVHGQSSLSVEKLQSKEMEKLTKIVTLTNENVAFSKNQTAKLERVFFSKAKEIFKLKGQEVTKEEYSQAYIKLEDKYNRQIQSHLTTEQKVEFRRNYKKPIKVSKD